MLATLVGSSILSLWNPSPALARDAAPLETMAPESSPAALERSPTMLLSHPLDLAFARWSEIRAPKGERLADLLAALAPRSGASRRERIVLRPQASSEE